MMASDPPMQFLRVLIGSVFPSLILPEKDHHRVWPAMERFYDTLEETGYFHLQATKPDTIGRDCDLHSSFHFSSAHFIKGRFARPLLLF